MKAILIDPATRSATPIEVSRENFLKDLYAAIDCDLVERVCIEDKQGRTYEIWVDESGLFKIDPEEVCMFAFGEYHQPLAGKGVLLGANAEFYESEDAPMTPEEAKSLTKFIRPITLM
jgi:hypothetical protein